MSIALIFSNRDPQNWQVEISKFLPETKVEIYPEIENFDEVEFIVSWKPHVDYFADFPNLKVIQSSGAGIDHLLPESLPKHIRVCRIVDPKLKSDMFEHVLACLMHAIKNFSAYTVDKIKKEWNPQRYKTIEETEVTILGLGELGKYVAEGLVKLGFRVKGWSNSKKDIADVTSFAGLEELKSAIDDTDFIVNILPLTESTAGILNKDFFKLCRSGTVLINVGRGGHVVEDDLQEAIESKHIKGAYLDVFNLEPLPEDHIFWKCENIFITPHVASMTNVVSSVQQVVENYTRMIDEGPLLNEVSLEKGY
ncbi:2-hydroxyacid dehydrogenase [Sphingobacterium sp. LRF_L2]|uniref:2-hydroxyacid dehydrogenase n=1 Tax=Sphingobacterium sp. LRF_L2 TaxID=3369421 RepID=UPI003F61065C